ncbi:PPOX class F420-dependent oxidoreductase [Kineococcus rubinsiae]|uniref:PPOX class F420-dependent oxidoreductase n=1 Tax=Kineococcus rubinsiae TaxID=2609562 RepID=UPI0014305176|nr:PPOX class F420-dependent oxidoreductase [Kineococcus rubinsiae]NIZ91669.1 PPOX class F420-dependent oxidoreductase [Kineococcus rubinsiae]
MSAPSGARPPAAFTALGAERFVSLTTFRRDGGAVATPVWIARLGEDLVVTTPAGSGKLKRLRHDTRVLLSPCGRFGEVTPGAPVVEAVAEVLGHDRDHPEEAAAVRSKYGLEHRIVVPVEALVRRRRRESTERIVLRLRPRPLSG